MSTYRIKLFTKASVGEHDGDQTYCIKNNLVAIGWGFENEPEIKLDEYKKRVEEKFGKDRNFKISYNNFLNLNKDDFVWVEINARDYRLGKIQEKYDKYSIVKDKEKCRMGLTKKCMWKKINFNDVPGEVINSCAQRGCTLIQKHNLDDFKEYFEYLYDKCNYNNTCILDYKKLLHYDDLEDLLGLYLQKEKGYFIIPSTNKSSTKLIEYELRRKNNGKIEKSCVQCKMGTSIVEDDIFKDEEFKDYKIYISTINNDNYDNKRDNVKTIYTDDLWNWAKDNKELLPERIQKYIEICK